MIVQWFMGVIATVVHTLTASLPVVPVPSWVTSAADGIGTVFGFASSMGAWVPLGLGTTVAAAVLTSITVGFVVKVVRILASFLTAGGGSAG